MQSSRRMFHLAAIMLVTEEGVKSVVDYEGKCFLPILAHWDGSPFQGWFLNPGRPYLCGRN